jgi:penicillin amidase
MKAGAQCSRQAIKAGNALAALAVSACLLGVLGVGYGTWPALGRALVPGHGAWTSAATAKLPRSQQLDLAGLTKPVQVSFTRQGLASISAQSDGDAYLALGYVHASFRLAEMDTERRVAEGRLAQLTGPSGVASDTFELRLGLLRTAQREWAQLPKSSPAAQALIAYSRGVNDYLAQVRASRQWPAEFSLAGVYPANWTPVDSLAVQGDLTQELDFTTTPLDYALLERALGPARTMNWFGVLPPDQQHPYDPGPYRQLGLAPMAGSQLAAARPATGTGAPGTGAPGTGAPGTGAPGTGTAVATAAAIVPAPTAAADSAGMAEAAGSILSETSAFPAGQLYTAPASNAWAANGPKVAGGGAMLAADPHLPQTLPSIWYQVALAAPGLAVSGASVPGLPGVLIGHNAHIAWSITDTQSQATLFYAEDTSPSRPRQYFWRGQWRRMQVLHDTIPVRGGATRPVYVDETVHGPVLTQAGQTVSVDWMGALGSPDLAAMLSLDQAGNYRQFKHALANWRSPALTFTYADDRGNIGAISPGYYPQLRHGKPWLPLTGTGPDDVAGVIPYAAVPQVYDPRSHFIATANQRPAGPAYPYYLGTTASFFDPGYRADAEYAYLHSHWSMHPASFAALQQDTKDQLASVIVPRLLAALHGMKLTPLQAMARDALRSWNGQMSAGSGGASIWWTFWASYLSQVFQPYWSAAKVPVGLDPSGLSIGPGQSSLDEDLEAWTLGDRGNAVFSSPGAAADRGADGVMRTAFTSAVSQLSALLGGGPGRWQWGKLHTRQFPSLTGATALGYGPRAASGDIWTVDAAEGAMKSVIGPSWRMIVGWPHAGTAGGSAPVAAAIYPGGQSENPASPWYANLVGAWWAGTYLPMPAAGAGGSVRWELGT